MSWFSELAGRAEALLDKMDQAAATSLHGAGGTPAKESKPFTTPPGPAPGHVDVTSEPGLLPYEPRAQPPSAKPEAPPSFHAVVRSTGSGSHPVSKLRTTTPPTGKVSPPEHPTSTTWGSKTSQGGATDDSLFEFLNSPSKPKESGRGGVRKVTSSPALTKLVSPPPAPLSPVKLQPSASSGPTVNQGQRGEGGGGKKSPPWDRGRQEEERGKETVRETDEVSTATEPGPTDQPDSVSSQPTSEPGESVSIATEGANDGEKDSTTVSSSTADKANSDARHQAQTLALQQKVSNLELENRLLKREVASMNDELSSVMGRVREAGEGVRQYEVEITSLREQASQADHVIRQLRSHEEDLQAALEARDSQTQVLRAQLSEGDKMVEELKGQITGSQKDRERLLQDVNLSSDAHNQALESLKVQLGHAQALLQQEMDAMAALKTEFAERESRLQLEQQQLSEALAAQQRQLSIQQAKTGESQMALRGAHSELQLLRKEHEEYKQRATGILQAKERLISSLQSGGEGGTGATNEARLEELRLEKEHLQAQLQTAQQHVQNLQSEIQELEERHGSELDQLLEQVRLSGDSLEEEKRSHAATRVELSQLSQEAEETRDAHLKERTELSMQLKDKDKELESMKAKSSLGDPATSGRLELESRLHELTDSLIQKQTSIETLSSEKSSLKVQLQRTKGQLAEAQRLHPHHVQTTVNGLEGTDSSASARIRPMSSVLPSDGRHLNKVRKALNTVDTFSIRLGVMLRRQPYARLFLLIYVVLLHIWVTFVLLTYTPEVHDIESSL